MSKEEPRQIVLGLTGPFGSGCSTLAKVLKQDHKFETFCLSDFVREKWHAENQDKAIKDAPREELQAVGNRLRLEKGHAILAEMAYDKAKKKRNSPSSDWFLIASEIPQKSHISEECSLIFF